MGHYAPRSPGIPVPETLLVANDKCFLEMSNMQAGTEQLMELEAAMPGAFFLFVVGPLGPVAIGLKRHHPARGRVSAGWRPRSGFNNAVPSTADSLE